MPTDQELIKIVPSSRQLAYQATEFYAFFHFGMNTYTNREWGDGTENPQIFNPTEFVADQWVDFGDTEFETLNGYLTNILGHIPADKDVDTSIKAIGYCFTILSIGNKTIGKVKVERDNNVAV